MGALEAEEVGVEHLLRDIRLLSGATLSASVEARVAALQSLDARLTSLQRYVADVRQGKLPLSQRIVGQLQDAFNLAPAVSRAPLAAAFATASNVRGIQRYVYIIYRERFNYYYYFFKIRYNYFDRFFKYCICNFDFLEHAFDDVCVGYGQIGVIVAQFIA